MKKPITLLIMLLLIIACAHAPSPELVQQKVYEHWDVDDFVAWLKVQPGITDVDVNKRVYLTTLPPKVLVSYVQNGQKERLLIAVDPGKRLKLVQPE